MITDFIWLANYPNAIILSILAWTINWLIDLQMGKFPQSGSLLWSQPQQDGSSDLRCTAPTPASMLFDYAPLTVYQHECWYTAKVCLQNKWPTSVWEKTHQGGTQSMLIKYNFSWRVVRNLWMRCVQLIIYQGHHKSPKLKKESF